MNQTSKNISGLVIDRENLINLIQMHSLVQLMASYGNHLASDADAELALEGISALIKEIEENIPYGEA